MSKHKTRRRLWIVVLILCLLIFLAALALLLWFLRPAEQPTVPPVDNVTTTTTTVALPENPIDFAAKQAENPHIVAWMEIPGTVIDYAIMRSGNDVPENFYLDHDENRQYRRSGSLYIQQLNRADFTNPNTVIYGHNMANGSMFAALHKFRKKDFFDEHQYIYVYTPGHILTYRIYSAFMYDNRHILNSFDFNNPEEYQSFLDQTLNPRSMTKQVRDDVSVTTDDRIITLSTCIGITSKRYLVQGVLIDDQPTR